MTRVAEKPTPIATPETQPFWDNCRRGVLSVQQCQDCGLTFFYPRTACPGCGSATALHWIEVSGRATLHSYVISHLQAPGFQPPYVIAVVELNEGPRLVSNLVGVTAEAAALTIDMPLVVDFETRGDSAVPVFRPLTSANVT